MGQDCKHCGNGNATTCRDCQEQFTDQPRSELKAAQEEIKRLQGFSQEEWRGTLCPACGPSVRVDEDGCCHTCGIDAMGLGVETAWIWREQRDAWREASELGPEHAAECSTNRPATLGGATGLRYACNCARGKAIEAARKLESGTEPGGESK